MFLNKKKITSASGKSCLLQNVAKTAPPTPVVVVAGSNGFPKGRRLLKKCFLPGNYNRTTDEMDQPINRQKDRPTYLRD